MTSWNWKLRSMSAKVSGIGGVTERELVPEPDAEVGCVRLSGRAHSGRRRTPEVDLPGGVREAVGSTRGTRTCGTGLAARAMAGSAFERCACADAALPTG